jgi:hypothetical protein
MRKEHFMAQSHNLALNVETVYVPVPALWKTGDRGSLHMEKLEHDPFEAFLPLDAWEVRNDFISLEFSERSPKQLLDYLNRVGVFATQRFENSEGEVQHPISIASAKEWQRYIIDLMGSPSSKWGDLSIEFSQIKVKQLFADNHFSMEFDASGRIPRARMTGNSALQAILATMHLDHFRGAKLRICQRADCHRVFEVDSLHNKIYCDQYCGHLVSLRHLRAKRKAEKEREAIQSRKRVEKAAKIAEHEARMERSKRKPLPPKNVQSESC